MKQNPARIRKNKEVHNADKEFYLEIWNERPHRCAICLKPLGNVPLLHFFHHILEKGRSKYVHLRYEKENIILVCKDHHEAFHAAYRSERLEEIIQRTIEFFSLKKLL